LFRLNNGLFVSPEFPVFEVNRDIVLPDVLDIFFRDPRILPLLQSRSTGTNLRRRRLNPEQLLEIEVPIPCPKDQETVKAMSRLKQKLTNAHQEFIDNLDKLLPSFLNRAFSGETAQQQASMTGPT
jgi:type I restriction enzyme, S subunit